MPGMMAEARRVLRRALAPLGAFMVPSSFIVSPPGSDIHYAGSLPMRANPARGELSRNGEVHGFDGLYVADASALPELSSKSHTLTMMANADRIGRHIASAFAGRSI
jgi:choline dehydrogenase-like flavoprotein